MYEKLKNNNYPINIEIQEIGIGQIKNYLGTGSF
jgi:hypothetical protein